MAFAECGEVGDIVEELAEETKQDDMRELTLMPWRAAPVLAWAAVEAHDRADGQASSPSSLLAQVPLDEKEAWDGAELAREEQECTWEGTLMPRGVLAWAEPRSEPQTPCRLTSSSRGHSQGAARSPRELVQPELGDHGARFLREHRTNCSGAAAAGGNAQLRLEAYVASIQEQWTCLKEVRDRS